MTAALNTMLAPWGFVDDGAFVTKAGHVGLVFRIGGVDYEGLDDEARRRHVHRFEAALRTLDTSCRLYQYLHKRPAGQRLGRTLYTLDAHLVLLDEGLQPARQSWRDWFSPAATLTLRHADLERALAHLQHTARGFEAHLDTLRLERLGKDDAFRFLRSLVNDQDSGVGLKYDTHVDYFMADASVECHRDRLLVGETPMKVLTMKEAPASTFALMLEELYALDGPFLACLEWIRLPMARARRDIHRRRRHFFNTRISIVNYLNPEMPTSDMLVDDSAGAVVHQLGAALTEIQVGGHFFGECSLTVVVSGPDVDRLGAEASKLLAAHDGAFHVETYNLLAAWVSIVPGNSAYNLRRLALLETHVADLSFLFTVDQGRPLDDAQRAPLLELATQARTTYRYHLHHADVGHTLVLGQTGVGKTYLLNVMAREAQRYDPHTVIFDLGHGYRALARQVGGRYLEFGPRADVTLNPFDAEPTPARIQFLHAFCRVLMEGRDGYRLDQAQDRDLHAAVGHVYVLAPAQRRLQTLATMLPRPLAARLEPWLEGGRLGHAFDHATDTFAMSRCQVFSFDAIRDVPELLEPLLFYILQRVEAVLAPSRLTLCIMDEAWRFVQHPTLRSWIETALKTWRKRNGAMVLATQSLEDFEGPDMLRTVVESCPTTLLLSNPAIDRAHYAEVFGLNEVELDLLASVRPRAQVLLKRHGLAKVLDVLVDPVPQEELLHVV